jgi:hypothetical protein
VTDDRQTKTGELLRENSRGLKDLTGNAATLIIKLDQLVSALLHGGSEGH